MGPAKGNRLLRPKEVVLANGRFRERMRPAKGNFACKIFEGLKARRYSGFWRFATAKCRNALLVLPTSLF